MSTVIPEIYQTDQFVARRQVFRLFGAGFTLMSVDGRPLASSEQKAFRWKEDIRVHLPEPEGGEILRIRADRIIDWSANYRVEDGATGEVYGSLRRKGWSSMFRDSWEILDAEGVIRGRVVEDSDWKALLRRFVDGVSFLMPQAFHIEVEGQLVGVMKQHFNPFVQKISVDFSADTAGLLPRPLGVATVILLLAIEQRQQGYGG
jgi:hypothetical protein